MYDYSIFSSPSVLMIFLSVEGRSMEYSEVVSAFSKLVETHFLQRCPPVAEMGTAATSATPATPGTPATPASTAPPTAESNPDCYKLPHVTLTGTANTLSHITRSIFSPMCIPTCKPPAICNSVNICNTLACCVCGAGRGKRRRSSDDSEEQRGGKKVKVDSEVRPSTLDTQR